jgi:AraC family transcriptional regulator of adaptative response / DNA-3-methyladenine glycosylase II
LRPGESWVRCSLWLDDLRDLAAAVQRCRRLLDLDADPAAVAEHLSRDAIIGHAVRRGPGRRLPGTVDGAELAMRAVLGQQVSVAGARTLAARLVRSLGEPLSSPYDELTHLFPTPASIASAGSAALRMPAARRAAVLGLAGALAAGDVGLDAGADRREVERSLLALPGIGPWTASYVAMRALGDPDAFLPTDLGVRRAFERLGRQGDARTVTALAEAWRPWRAYALHYLWGIDAEAVAA